VKCVWLIVVVTASLVMPARSFGAPPARWGEDELRWAKNIEKNKGQIEALLGVLQAGGSLRAEAARPLVSRSEAFGGSLRQRDPALHDALLSALQDLVKSVEKGEPIAREAQRALPLLDRALETLIAPRVRTNPRFRAAVMASLLLDAAEEYEEWLDEGNPGDYFEGWGNLQRASAYWQTLLPAVRARSRNAFQEIQAALGTFGRFFKSPVPPPREQAPSADELEEAAEDAVSALGEALGGPVLRRGNPLEHAQAAVGYLERARTAYRAGNGSLALEYVYAAYVDHYEESKVQKPLAAVAPELEKRITALVRQVRARMRTGAPVPEVDGPLAQVLAALRDAQTRLRTR
jgi:hypothetical protein